ncbi:MAG: hypothetical protein KZQ83_06200 [gamma proteobacterium symbiont of Taylorina sp.]|nr:hypothetical protein [gamma proteobacterium symbiont of Taylorina sp.]
MKGYSLDPHPRANYAEQHFAVIYSPRKKRKRFPATVVTLYDSDKEAVKSQNHDKNLFAAEVVGPAKSSEGIHLFYLLKWL